MRRYLVLLPIIALVIPFALPTPADAVTLPAICGKGKWVSCGNNAYYCTAMSGDSCKRPTFVVTRTMENWAQKQSTSTQVAKGKTVAPSYRYVTKYVKKRICTKNVKTKKWSCRYVKVKTKVAVRR